MEWQMNEDEPGTIELILVPSDSQAHFAAYFGLARTYNRLEQTNNEINIYHQLLSIEPMTISALQNLGNAYMKKEMYEEAIEQYLTAVEIEPENPALHYNLGVAYSNMELHEDAVDSYLRAIEFEPDNGAAYNGAAVSYYMLKEHDLARKYVALAEKLGFKVQKELLKALK